jgi:(4S)-4-hydroxy-5-phosphonooxypentane-2,3-dione isomerase
MTYTVIATWRARDGETDACREILRLMTPLTRAEPGCRTYVVHQSLEDAREFVIYEQYDDEAALQAHRESEHFKTHVLGDAVHRLEERYARFYESLD